MPLGFYPTALGMPALGVPGTMGAIVAAAALANQQQQQQAQTAQQQQIQAQLSQAQSQLGQGFTSQAAATSLAQQAITSSALTNNSSAVGSLGNLASLAATQGAQNGGIKKLSSFSIFLFLWPRPGGCNLVWILFARAVLLSFNRALLLESRNYLIILRAFPLTWQRVTLETL